MSSDKTISQIFAKFNIITNNDLSALDKIYSSIELVNKMLRSLSKGYQGKVVAIREARDLSKLLFEELMG